MREACQLTCPIILDMHETMRGETVDDIATWHADQAAAYLDGIRGKAMRMKSLAMAIESNRETADGLKSMDYSRGPVSATASDDAIPDAVDSIDRLTQRLESMRDECHADIEAAHRALDSMGNSMFAAILEMHYLCGEPWNGCAEAFGYSKRGIMKLRPKALAEFYEVMPETRRSEIPSAI